MGIRKDLFVEYEFYHVYNRGNSKQDIFLDNQDRDRFIKLLYMCNSSRSFNFKEDIVQRRVDVWEFDRGEQIVSIGAWVLMPNHFHLYITPRSLLGGVGGNESALVLFMRKLCTGYSMYFNKKYGRTGKLFEGSFKSVRSIRDPQAKYIFSYIHLNPLKIIDPLWKKRGVKNIKFSLSFLNTYRWSSYHDYRNIARPEQKILTKEYFPEYFSDKNVFEKEIFDWLTFTEETPRC